MTEGESLDSSDSQAMLGWRRTLRGASERRLRLFAAACCRHFGLLGQGAKAAAAVGLAERYAEGEAPRDAVPDDARRHAVWAADPWEAAAGTARQAAEEASCRSGWQEPLGEELWVAYDAAEDVLCHLLRDLFGPAPFRPPRAVAPSVLSWNGGVVGKLAWAAYEDL